jgi:trehalose 6-phosphate phosphatase
MSAPLGRGRPARAAFAWLVRARHPILFLDLDGTLAPLVERPSDARVPAVTRQVLARLRAGGARVVLVSGRSVAAVRRIARLAPDAILGDHGARLWRGGRTSAWLPADPVRLARIHRRIAPRLATLAGVRLERKDRSLAIHLRLSGSGAPATIGMVTRLLEREGLRVLRGRQVIDAQLPRVDKGRAVRRWLKAEPTADVVLYAGDDTTDQDAFAALDGRAVTIAVGPRARGARFRTRDPGTFARWLGRLADARSMR